MHIFMDESGDPGSKITGGSSKFLVIAMVLFANDVEAAKARQALSDLKKTFKKSEKFEFKFTKLSRGERLAALKAVSEFDFKVRAVVYNKEEMTNLAREYFKGNYYKYALRSLMDDPAQETTQAVVKIDTFGEREYRQKLKDYFLLHLSQNKGKKYQLQELIFEDSKYDELLQLADLVAGSIRKSFDKRSPYNQDYRQVFIEKEEEISVFKEVLNQRG
jgi:hypothetical protein